MVFENIVSHSTGLFNFIIPLGEMAIGLGLILGVLAYTASFFWCLCYDKLYLSRYDFYVPFTISIFIILLMSHSLINKISLKEVITN